ncbi:hypothetical protein [Planotetraspora silvatica]|nr:hypothetical protein [Planotetraspora silvatica]
MLGWLESIDPSLAAALISAVVSVAVAVMTVLLAPTLKYGLDSRLESRKLDLHYRSEQRKALREHIARHKGRILETAADLNDRLANFVRLADAKDWLVLEGRYPGGSYSRTFAQRLISHWCVIQQFTDSAIYVDATVATKGDLAFLKILRLNIGIWTDASLFEGLPYDPARATEHFFQGQLSDMVTSLLASADGDGDMTLGELRRAFTAALDDEPETYRSIFMFLDGLQPGRLKYQRLLAAHLMLMITLNDFGYDHQRTAPERMRRVVDLLDPLIRRNFVLLLREAHVEEQTEVKALLAMLALPGDK